MKRRTVLKSKLLWVAAIGVIAFSGVTNVARTMVAIPEDLDFSLTRPSDRGIYVTKLNTGTKPVTTGAMHVFTLTMKTRDGRPVDNAALSIAGGMPQHGHGLPTKPRVTAHLGNGRYRLEGVKFNMRGWWVLTVHAESKDGNDNTTFNLKL